MANSISYNRYSTVFKLMYKFNLLSKENQKQAPASTKQYWRKQQFTDVIGMNSFYISDDKIALLEAKLAKSALLIKALRLKCGLLKQVLFSQKNYLQLFDHHKTSFVSVIDRLKDSGFSLSKICTYLGFTSKKYHYWKNSLTRVCGLSLHELCYAKHPNQLSLHEVNTIRSYAAEFPNDYLISIYYRMVRDGKAFLSDSTFYLYCRILGIRTWKPKVKILKKGIRASFPFHILHMDVTQLRLKDNTKAYIYILMDNFSRFILSATASLEYNSTICKENIIKAFSNPDVPFPTNHKITLFCDGGSENKGQVDLLLNDADSPYDILKLVASKINFTNAMVEALNKKIKYKHLFKKEYLNIKMLQNDLPNLLSTFNYDIPNGALFGLTPKEVLIDKLIPDKKRFSHQIQLARKNRIAINKTFGCNNPCLKPK